METFPVLKSGYCSKKERELIKTCPDNIPFLMVERQRAFIERAHSQTLEVLAQRGGLGPEELYYELQELKFPFSSDDFVSLESAIKWLKWRVKLIRGY